MKKTKTIILKIKLGALLESMGTFITGISEAISFIKEQDVKLKQKYRNKLDSNPVESQKNYYYDINYTRYAMDDDVWSDIQTELDFIDTHKKSTSPYNIDLETNTKTQLIATLETHFRFRSYVEGMLKIIHLPSKKMSELIANIFCVSYSTLIANSRETILSINTEVSYTSLAKKIGEELVSLVFLDFMIINNYTSDKFLELGKEKIKQYITIIFGDFELSNNVFKYKKKPERNSTENLNDRILLFEETFPSIKNTNKFSRKDYAKLITLINLMLLKKVYSLAKNQKINKENELGNSDQNGYFYNFFCSLYLNKADQKEKNKFFDVFAININNTLEYHYTSIGHDIIYIFEKNGHLTTKTYKLTNNKNSQFMVKLNDSNFVLNIKGGLPSVFLAHENVVNGELLLKKKPTREVHNNYYITGNMSDELVYDKQMRNTPYILNYPFLIEFFTQINTFKNVDVLQEEHLSNFCAFLGNFYNINFAEFIKTKNDVLKQLMQDLVLFAFDFKNFYKFTLEKYDPVVIADHLNTLKTIVNQIYSKKIILNLVFKHIKILLHFDCFYYEWFSDARGRKMAYGLLNLQSHPILRSFVSFKNTNNLEDIIAFKAKLQKIPENDMRSTYISNLKNMFITQLLDVSKKKLDLNENLDFFKIIRTLPPNKGFEFFVLYQDYLSFNTDPLNAFYWSAFHLDSNASCYQIASILFKSYKLASVCSLVNGSEPIYETVLTKLKTEFLIPAKNICTNLSENLKFLLTTETIFDNNNYETIKNEFENIVLPIPYSNLIFKEAKAGALLELVLFFSNLTEDDITMLFSRKLIKVMCMLKPYNARLRGTVNQMLEKLMELHLLEGKYYTKQKKTKIFSKTNLIYAAFDAIFLSFIPEAMYFVDAINKYAKKNHWKTFVMDLNHFFYSLKPNKLLTKRFLLGSRKNGGKRVSISFALDELDWPKFRRSLPANFYQSCDAFILSMYLKEINKYNEAFKPHMCIYTYTNHDCFYIDINHGPLLKEFLINAYKELYEARLFEKNFKKERLFYGSIKKKFKLNRSLLLNEVAENPEFVK